MVCGMVAGFVGAALVSNAGFSCISSSPEQCGACLYNTIVILLLLGLSRGCGMGVYGEALYDFLESVSTGMAWPCARVSVEVLFLSFAHSSNRFYRMGSQCCKAGKLLGANFTSSPSRTLIILICRYSIIRYRIRRYTKRGYQTLLSHFPFSFIFHPHAHIRRLPANLPAHRHL